MSSSSSEETEMVFLSKEPSWNSIESIFNQKLSKLTASDSWINISSRFSPTITLSDFELRRIPLKDLNGKSTQWEAVGDRTWFPRIKRTRSLLKDELEILKVNTSINDNVVPLKHSQLLKRLKMEATFRRRKKIKMYIKKPVSCWQQGELSQAKDLVYEIEKSESAKRDKTAWKFLKRGSALKKEFMNSTKLALEIQVLQPSGFDPEADSQSQNVQPVKITCPNCLFYITTTVKNVKSIRFKLISIISATVGCIFPDVFYTFRDAVHLCPFCKIYLGFCPTFHVRAKKNLSSVQLNLSWHTKRKENAGREKKIKGKPPEEVKMVSASSTSAKNLFVESKLRLSDRVQVNVNNIAAITRQIQRGSKSTENLMTAAKNFAIQEAAIENSETNLKKLKLLTTHINNQLDSLHNSSTKMEVVLEQVRSMQR